ncbi:MarR family winged helix-turn-helix transcriptional regulator [Rhizosaccharibacter radicis]|uniref:MarR family transcriptional regulator n=1 Tax=Rhizosaccharibacter radicis TaxID=2782605 RepID=A0ABT1W406_9PROT|nr:MarR family transcriptional regulator [Acetobacteraceae bacterium KSS12]
MAADPPVADPALLLTDELRAAISALNRRLREQATASDLTTAQKSVLLRLERDGPATGSALARAEAMRPQSMGAIVSALRAAGYVSLAPDPLDRRQIVVSLTDTWRRWAAEARSARRDWLLRAVKAELSAAEQQQLGEAVRLLRRLVAA